MADTIVVRVTNNSGRPASDVHVQFSGSGGNVTVDPAKVAITMPPSTPVTPPFPPVVPSNPPAVSNEANIQWTSNGQPNGAPVPAVPDGAEVTFPASTTNGPLQIQSVTWSFPPSAPMVLHSTGEMVPFEPDHSLGAMISGGMSPEVAKVNATTLNTVVQSIHSPENPVVLSTAAVKTAIGEMVANPGPAAVSGVAAIVRAAATNSPAEKLPPIVASAPAAPAPASIVDVASLVAQALGDHTVLSESGPPALVQLLTNTSRVAAQFESQLEDPSIKDFQTQYLSFSRMLAAGPGLAAFPETFFRWRDQCVELTNSLATACEAMQGEIVMAKVPLAAMANTLAALQIPQMADVPWQGPVLASLLAIPARVNFDLSPLLTVCLFRKLNNNCPPCGASCPYGASTTYQSITLSNPQKCTTHTISIPIGETGSFWTIWMRTCTWDAQVHWKQVFSCYGSRLARAIRFPACCTGIREWDTTEKQSRQYTQGTGSVTKTFRPAGPALNNTVQLEKTGTSTDPAPNPTPPPDAKKTY
jgi:hypothetical protein